jgi:hypothetical protein
MRYRGRNRPEWNARDCHRRLAAAGPRYEASRRPRSRRGKDPGHGGPRQTPRAPSTPTSVLRRHRNRRPQGPKSAKAEWFHSWSGLVNRDLPLNVRRAPVSRTWWTRPRWPSDVRPVMTSDLLSGSHVGSSPFSAISCSGPPSAETINTRERPSDLREKAIKRPSGDHAGYFSHAPVALVSLRTPSPSTALTQM